jgi:hypothetical protein
MLVLLCCTSNKKEGEGLRKVRLCEWLIIQKFEEFEKNKLKLE